MAKKNIGVLFKDGKSRFGADMKEVRKLEQEDPLAYSYGFIMAVKGSELGDKSSLAAAYTRGWYDGRRVYVGEAEPPEWLKVAK